MKETYRTACYIFIFFLVVSVAVIASRQIEANGYRQNYIECTQQVIELVKEKTGGCGNAQLSELKECRSKLEILNEVKGKYEEKTNHSLAVVKQVNDFREMMTKLEDRLAKEAESKESCEQYIRQLEVNAREFLQNVTILVREKTALELKYKTCTKQHSTIEHELETCTRDLKKQKSVETNYQKCTRQQSTCSDELRTCKQQLKKNKSSSVNRMKTDLKPMYCVLIACVGILIHWTFHF